MAYNLDNYTRAAEEAIDHQWGSNTTCWWGWYLVRAVLAVAIEIRAFRRREIAELQHG